MLALTMDNVSSNYVLADTFGDILRTKFDVQFIPDNGYMHCLDHVTNLVVQTLLAALEEADDPDNVDYFPQTKATHRHYDVDDDQAVQDLQSEFDEETLRLNGQKADIEEDPTAVKATLKDAGTWSEVKKVYSVALSGCLSDLVHSCV